MRVEPLDQMNLKELSKIIEKSRVNFYKSSHLIFKYELYTIQIAQLYGNRRAFFITCSTCVSLACVDNLCAASCGL